jgi:serine/threonine-protein kinase
VDPLVLQGGADAPSALLAGRYRLLGHIGAGGMASIYRGRDEVLDRDVAVKVLHPHLATDPAVRERFRAEARAAAALVSPHVVNVFDSGADDLPFIVMEYVDGPSLRQVLSARGRLSPGEALAVLEPVCAGLTRAHTRGLVHRDVKPENVLVTTDGTVKVADFGLVRAIEETGATTSGSLLASVHYVAPELVRGGEASPASDQYAVGVLLYELLTGRQPFAVDGSPAAIALRHTREVVPPPSAAVPGLPAALDAVVARATAADPRDRFVDLTSFLAALRAAVPDGPEPVLVPGQAAQGNGTLVIPRETLETTSVPAAALDARPRFSRGSWRRRVPPRRRLGLVALLLVPVLVAAGVWFAYDRLVAPVRLVPPVLNLPRDEAVDQIRGLGLVDRFDQPVSSRTVPVDAVVAMTPEPGTVLRRGDEVRLTLSAGPARLPMPRVLELSRAEALDVLQGPPYHLTVRADESYSDAVPAEIVLAQEPQPDVLVQEGSSVIINVSLGVEQVEVPDLVGRSREQAERLLAEARLEGDFSEEPAEDDEEPGEVLSQSIDEGTEVDAGSTIEVVVAVPAAELAMPDVQGQPIDAAVTALEGLGLEVEVVERPVPSFGPIALAPIGYVREQRPAPGETVSPGDRVRLVIFAEDG